MRVTRQLNLVILFFSIILLIVSQPFNHVLAANKQHTLTIWGFYPKQYVQRIIDNYTAVRPDTKIIYNEHKFHTILSTFKERAHQGLGPDAVILPERDIPELIKLNLIEKLDKYKINTTNWHPNSLTPLRGVDGSLYGIPIAFQTMGLCYNKVLVDTPAKTLDEFLQQSKQGADIGIETKFLKSMWGIGLFGGQFFDSANNFVLQPESVTKWLNWLTKAESNPAFYFDSRPEFLFNLFVNGQLSYFPCWNFEFRVLKEQMENKLGITRLPSTSMGGESPYTEVDTLLINVNANPEQKKLAVEFGSFKTELSQQIHLINEVGNLYVTPINRRIKINQGLFPILDILDATAKSSAVSFPMSETYNIQRIRHYGDLLFNQVLQGGDSPEEAVKQFFANIKNPPPDENIVITSSVSGKDIAKLDTLGTKPDLNYLFDSLSILGETLKRPLVFLEISSVTIIILIIGILANRINKWLKNLLD